MSIPEKIQGFTLSDPNQWSHAKVGSYEPKPFKDHDVLIKVNCCSLCGSDVHTAAGSWGPYNRPDLVVGHELVGTIVKTGPAVTRFKEGDRVGVGPSSNSCGSCKFCKADNEMYCKSMVGTYNTPDPFSDGYVTQGGLASHITVSERFVAKIPDSMSFEDAAPYLCAGLTVFTPLYTYGAKDKTVGVIGIGGLGHFAVQFAKAMGAKKVVALSRSSKKRDDAIKLGADELIATGEDQDWDSKYDGEFDLMLNCASSFSDLDLSKLLGLVKPGGYFVTLGVPDVTQVIAMHAYSLIKTGAHLVGSMAGSNKVMNIMLKFGAEHKILPWIEKVKASETNYTQAFDKLQNGTPKFRIVLTDLDEFFDN